MREDSRLFNPSVNLSAEEGARIYGELKTRLIELSSASELDMPAIDEVIDLLAQAQLAFKAAHGLIGNNPIDD